MRAFSHVVAAVVATVLCRTAAGQVASSPAVSAPPSTGTDVLATGSALTAIGILSFATAPICKTSVVILEEQSSCFGVSFAVGTPFLAAGIPLIVVGAMERASFVAWMRSHPALAGISFSPNASGVAIGWSVTF
jgi:hypothetical protein